MSSESNNNIDNKPQNENDILICQMTIELDEGKVTSLNVYKHSNPEELAFQFCKEYNCNFAALKDLKVKIKNLIKRYNETNKELRSKDETTIFLKNNLLYNNDTSNDKSLLFKPDKSPLLNSTKHPLKNNLLLLSPEQTYNSKDIKQLNDKYNHSHISLMELIDKHKKNIKSHNHKKTHRFKSKSISETQITNSNIPKYNNKPKVIKTSNYKSNYYNQHQSTGSSLSALSDYTNQILFGTLKEKPKLSNNTLDLAFKPFLYLNKNDNSSNNLFNNKPKSHRSNRLNTEKITEPQSYLKHYLSKSILNTNDSCCPSEKSLNDQKIQLQRAKAVEERKEKMFKYLLTNLVDKEKNMLECDKISRDLERIVKWLFPKILKGYSDEKIISYMKHKFEKLSFLDKKCLFDYYHHVNIS